ncbi:BACON domain-containing protein [Parabacteroides goldsteinii]|uniref:BACON domain-containing protein n=1 Tax=Parabacteroides goldsteinii TaxID=328812 RepID=UPI00259B8420|nr:BACON domain-containing carbohydrate-binding protein [Parabacteroides goldsteinii]
MNKRLLACFLLTVLYCSCTQNEVVTGMGKGKEVSTCFHLNVLASTIAQTRSMVITTEGTTEVDSIPVPVGGPKTRSTTDPGESADRTIQNLWAGQYNEKGELVANEYFSSLVTQESVNLPLKRLEETSHVWVVANAGNLQEKAGTEADLKALTTSEAFTDKGLPVSNLCLMSGMWSGKITENISEDIQLKRSLAKIKFSYSVSGENFSFTPATLELCHVPVSIKYIGDGMPRQLSGDGNFKTYTVTSPGNSGIHYWYIPENPAGTGNNIEEIPMNKTGEGVSYATCIRLTGKAVQDGVTYSDVVFTLYPGNGNNDYNIIRNGFYTIDIKLTGIDFSDKRVTVGTVPEMQDPNNLGAEKGATSIFQVTTRPGVKWSFTIPTWLSAVVGDKTYEAGNKLDFIGPYKVQFEALAANPRAEVRETSFTVGEKDIYVRQNASSLSVGSSSVSLKAEGSSTGSSTFKATKGLPWAATLASEWGDWLAWNGVTPVSGTEATGENEILAVKATSSNPSASSRTGTILLKGGDAISETGDTDLTESISVTQAGASIEVTDLTPKLGPEADEKLSDSFVATHDLLWVATVTSGTDWLSLLTPESGTTGTDSQIINYKTSLNLNASERRGKITVRVGNEIGNSHPGPSKVITVAQAGSVFEVSPTVLDLESTVSSGTVIVTGTKGLPWTVNPSVTKNGITPGTTSGITKGGSQTLTFSSTTNIGVAREAIFTIAVTGGNHSKVVKVKQAGLTNTVTINQELATAYKNSGVNLTSYPPFNHDNGNVTGTGSDYKGESSSCTIPIPYTIEVENIQSTKDHKYKDGAAKNYCTSKGEGWRLPTVIELYAMWTKCKGTNSNAADDEEDSKLLGTKFINMWYWSSTVGEGDSSRRTGLHMGNGSIVNGETKYTNYIRCVRDI